MRPPPDEGIGLSFFHPPQIQLCAGLIGMMMIMTDGYFCSFCKNTIKAIYGVDSEELDKFNKAIRS